MEAVIAIYEEVIAKRDSLTAVQLHLYCKMIREAPGDRAMVIYWARRDGWWDQDDAETCAEILKAPNNELVIERIKREGWWKDEVAEPCQAILDAVVLHKEIDEKRDNLTAEQLYECHDQILEVCEQIRQADGDRAWTIFKAKRDGWWDQDDADTCAEIRKAPGDQAIAIYWARRDGWWDQDDAETCAEIRKAPGNRAWAIYWAKRDGWWDQDDAETYETILNSPGSVAEVIYYLRGMSTWNRSDAETCALISIASGDREKVIEEIKQEGWWVEPSTTPAELPIVDVMKITLSFKKFTELLLKTNETYRAIYTICEQWCEVYMFNNCLPNKTRSITLEVLSEYGAVFIEDVIPRGDKRYSTYLIPKGSRVAIDAEIDNKLKQAKAGQ